MNPFCSLAGTFSSFLFASAVRREAEQMARTESSSFSAETNFFEQSRDMSVRSRSVRGTQSRVSQVADVDGHWRIAEFFRTEPHAKFGSF
jgi:hypothetical protein